MCVGVCVWACARRMLTVTAARRGDACMCESVCLALHEAHGHGGCWEATHACVGVCDLLQRMLSVIAARRCIRVLVCVFLFLLCREWQG
jgi:hypothetical protein